jgi:hypothetical protein
MILRVVLPAVVTLAVLSGCSPQPSSHVSEQLAVPAADGEVRSVDLMIDAPEGASAAGIVCRGATAELVTQLLGAEIAHELNPDSPAFLAAIVYLDEGEALATEEFGQGPSATDWLFVPCREGASYSDSVTLLEPEHTRVDFVVVDDPVHPRWYLADVTG